MKILILGGKGMLGHKAYQVLSESFDTYATFQEPDGEWTKFPTYQDRRKTIGGVNGLQLDTVIRSLAHVKPDVVINCIGIIKQSKTATDPLKSIATNSLFPHRLAQLASAVGARLIHISTDCVFSGRKGNYIEDDVPDAEDLYGRSKLLGEVCGPGCLTVRTSIIGRDFLKASSLLEWFLANRNGRIAGYENAIFSGFPTQVFARILRDIIKDHSDLSGLYHVASRPISKYTLLTKLREAGQFDIEIDRVAGPSCDRSLDPTKFVTATGYQFPSWDDMIVELLSDKTPYDDWKKQHAIS